MHKTRLEAFSDGVVAILITIMVLELRVPGGADWAALRTLGPTLSAYVLSFVYLGIYWNNHHHLFHVVDRVGALRLRRADLAGARQANRTSAVTGGHETDSAANHVEEVALASPEKYLDRISKPVVVRGFSPASSGRPEGLHYKRAGFEMRS
jgi:hypothetical protein